MMARFVSGCLPFCDLRLLDIGPNAALQVKISVQCTGFGGLSFLPYPGRHALYARSAWGASRTRW